MWTKKMDYIQKFKTAFFKFKNRLEQNSFDSLLWLVNITPRLSGFSTGRQIKALFWVVHIVLMLYGYGVGNTMFVVTHMNGQSEFIKSYTNYSMLIISAVDSYWFFAYRPQFLSLIEEAKENDKLTCTTSPKHKKKHEKYLRNIKRLILLFYGMSLTYEIIYIPSRFDVISDYYCLKPCIGLEPLTSTPNRAICFLIICIQEITTSVVVLNYEALLLFLIAHTSTMYHMMAEEIMDLKNFQIETTNYVHDRLSILLSRYVLTLNSVDKIKNIYSMSIGVSFAVNAFVICLFFFLPLEESIKFLPLLGYCFLVFFLYCILCQKLINASEEFEKAVYSCGWENFEAKDRKSIYIMLLQAQKPITILAADIIPVNVATFASTCQAIYKFVTVVKL